MKIEERKVSDLKFYPGNPRKISDEMLKSLKKSIQEFGVVDPLVVNTQNEVIGGNQRLKAIRDLGIEKVPVVVVDLPKSKEKALNLALNKISGEWDEELLKSFVEDIEPIDLELTGFNDEDISELKMETGLIQGLVDDDEIPEETESVCKKGDLWQLGDHRLLCGDATKKEDVEKLMGGRKADMVFTDPPYGMFLNTDFSDMKGIGRGNKYKPVQGDNEDFTVQLVSTIFENLGYCKEIFLWGADYYAELIPNRNKGAWIVWDKMQGGEGVNDDYDKMFGSNFELCWSKAKHKRAIARVLWKGIFGLAGEDTKKRVHPTQKPVKLCLWFFEKFAKKGDVVVDLYGGSGTTLIACEKLGCKCRMMEIDKHYCDVIIQRWENFTGRKAEKIG